MRFWRNITRWGQLPLLFIPWLLIVIIAANMGSNYPRDEHLAYWLTYPDTEIVSYDWIAIAVLSGFSFFCSYLFGSIIKLCHYKDRPEPQPYSNWREKIDASSFPSIHTSNSLIAAFRGVIASIGLIAYREYTVGERWISAGLVVFWVVFYLCISYSRVVLRKHYRIDLCGGTTFALFILAATNYREAPIRILVHKICSFLFI